MDFEYENSEFMKTLKRGFGVVPIKHRTQWMLKYEDIILPKRSTKYSAGYDFFMNSQLFVIQPKTTRIYWTDVCAFMEDNEVLKIYIRSSIAIKKGLILRNGVGIIDKDYFANEKNYGNIGIALYNTTNNVISLSKGEKIAQGIFEKYYVINGDSTDEERKGGVGSTT